MATTRSVWLQELTWPEVATYLETDDIVLFPVGSTEQHGPAGPLGVDSYAAIALAEDAARATGVLVTPPCGSAIPPTTWTFRAPFPSARRRWWP